MGRVFGTGGRQAAGYYQTGEGEKKTFTQAGKIIRMGPNSSISPTKSTRFFSGLLNTAKNMLLGTGRPESVPAGVRGVVPSQGGKAGLAIPAYHQVGPQDTSMAAIAKKYGLNLGDVVNANGGQATIPGKGSYIALQPEGASLGHGPGPKLGASAEGVITAPGRSPVGYGPAGYVPAGPQPSRADSSPTQGRGGLQAAYAGPIQAAQNFSNSLNQFNQYYAETGQVNPALLPSAVSLATVQQMAKNVDFVDPATGEALTPAQAMNQYGFEFKNGQFVQTGAPVVAGGGKPGPGQEGYNPSGKASGWHLERTKRGGLTWKRAGSGRAETPMLAPALPPEAANAASTPSTILELRLGSG